MLVDSHCHLDFDVFDDDRDAVIVRAREAGVGTMVTISTRLTRFPEVLAIAESYGQVYCSVGVHPHQAAEEGIGDPGPVIARTGHPKVVGIGETGLDFYYDNSPRDDQRRSFAAHIAAAQATGLPLIVHTRDADEETAAILSVAFAAAPFSGVLHCFSSGRALAEAALEIGFYISFSGIATFKRSDELRDIARDVPLDRILVETDAPFLAPVPNRGKRNEPAYVRHTAELLAGVKGMAYEDFARATTANFFRLFEKAAPCNATGGEGGRR